MEYERAISQNLADCGGSTTHESEEDPDEGCSDPRRLRDLISVSPRLSTIERARPLGDEN